MRGKKTILPAAFAAAVLLLGSGCSQSAPAGGDYSLTVEGESFRCMDNITQVTAALGEGYDYAEGKSCAYDGLDQTYTYETATFYTSPLEEGDMVSEIYTNSPQVQTEAGIAVGATRDEVVAAYGEPDSDDGSLMVYRGPGEAGTADGADLCFELTGDEVTGIFLTLQAV